MPVYFNDSIDDILLYDRQASFIGGQVSNFRENLLNDSQAELIKDMSPEISGVLKTRRGFHRFANLLGSTSSSTNVQAIHFFDSDSRERVIAAVNSSLYEIESDGTVTSISVAASKLSSASNPAYMCQVADKMYWSSDTTTTKIFELKYSGGAWVKTDSTDTTYPANSKYLIANSGRVFAYDPSGNQIFVSTILPDLAATSTLFTLGATTINPFKVGTGAETVTGMYSWVGFNVVVFCENSIYLVDTNPLTAAAAAAGNATSTFKVRQVSNRSGAVSHRAVAQVGEDLIFLASDGVRSLKRTMAEEMVAEQSGVISYPIQDLIDSINWSAAAQKATATFWNGLLLISVPILSSTENNCVLVYSADTNSWIGYWQGNPDYNIKPVDFCIAAFGGYAEKLLTLDKVGNPLEFRDYVSPQNAVATDYQDNFDGSNYRDTAWKAVTRGMTFGDQLSPKSPEFCEWEFDRSNAKVDIIPILDGDDADRLVTDLETGVGAVTLTSSGPVLPFTLSGTKVRRFRYSLTQYDPFRELQFRIEQSTGDTGSSKYVSLRSIHSGAFIDTMESDQ